MYRVVSYYLNEPAPGYNRNNLFKDFVVCQERKTREYSIKTPNEYNNWRVHLWICENWGVRVYNENDELVYEAGEFANGWVEPTPYGDQYIDQPDAL